jgi:hypothetical protein
MRSSQILCLASFVLTGFCEAAQLAESRKAKKSIFVLTGHPPIGGESQRAFQNVRFCAQKVAISHAIFRER